MTCTECTWVLWWVALSVILFVAAVGVRIALWAYYKFSTKNVLYYRPGSNNLLKLLVFSGLVLAAFFMHYAVGCFLIHHPERGAYVPTYAEEIVDALFRAVRTTGVPEHYTEFVKDFRAMLEATMPEQNVAHDWLTAYITAVNISIPVAGSALILGIFAKAFPKVALWLKNNNPWREKCYFSGLNPQSLALAKSIVAENKAQKKLWRPLIVFTDAYVDDEAESSFEAMLEAKQMGAICLRDDLAHVLKARRGDRKYFLMEEDEYANLPALMGLMEERNAPYIKSAFIYLFVQSQLYERLNENIRARLKAEHQFTEEELPRLVPVNAHRNLVQNLFVSVPLFEPLIGREDTDKLGVTILGNGSIGTEAFLSTYWFGQMLGKDAKPVALDIHVVSQDTPAVFAAKMDYINPEIRRTCRNGSEEEKEKDAILEWADGKTNAYYATVTYHSENVKAGCLSKDPAWLQSEYFVVALGSDADNIAVAEKLRSHIGKKHVELDGPMAHTVIAYVVYDPELCDALNARHDETAQYGVYMHAFGSLDEVYSSDNVFMSKSRVLAEQTGLAYQQRNPDAHKEEQAGREDKKTNYNYCSDLARAMHIKYKIFSLGWIQHSLFCQPDERQTEMERLSLQYRRVCGVDKELLATEDQSERRDLEKKRERLAWLEHRRWNAFLRSIGYRHIAGTADHTLKLHWCLVEAGDPWASEEIDNYKYDTGVSIDKLDAVIPKGKKIGHYKQYDYPENDVGVHRTPACWAACNRNADGTVKAAELTEQELRSRCEKGMVDGAFFSWVKDGEDWLVPSTYLERWLGYEACTALSKERTYVSTPS
ncbi:MAG: hypothetical protein IJN04_01355 [Clostridia bacterium]|nr:hypothetical protein [Clostridia bacterium]